MRMWNYTWHDDIECNLVEVYTEKTRIIIDCGRYSPPSSNKNEADFFEFEGLMGGKSDVDAVFVMNYHADHLGYLERINPEIPIYMNKYVKDVLDIFADFADAELPRVDKYLKHGCKEQIGDISVLPIYVELKKNGKMMLLFEGDGERFLYTEGFKHIDPAYYAMLGDIDVIMCECIHFGSKDDIDIGTLEDEAVRLMHEADGHVFVLCSPTDDERIKIIERACRRSGRSMVIDPLFKTVQEQIANPLFINPVGIMPSGLELTPRIQKHITTNYDIDFENIQYFSDTNAVAKMSNLTFLMCPSMLDTLRHLNDLTPLSGSALINILWRGYEESESVKKLIDTCRTYGMSIRNLHVSNFNYREQLHNAVLQLNIIVLAPLNDVGHYGFNYIHKNTKTEVIHIFEGDVAFTLACAEYDKAREKRIVSIIYKGKKYEWEFG